MANLQRVLSRIQDFFLEFTGSTVTSPHLLPDVRLLAEFSPAVADGSYSENAAESVLRFLKLTVGCAVSCSRREHFIEAILELETHVQSAVMEAVKLVSI